MIAAAAVVLLGALGASAPAVAADERDAAPAARVAPLEAASDAPLEENEAPRTPALDLFVEAGTRAAWVAAPAAAGALLGAAFAATGGVVFLFASTGGLPSAAVPIGIVVGLVGAGVYAASVLAAGLGAPTVALLAVVERQAKNGRAPGPALVGAGTAAACTVCGTASIVVGSFACGGVGVYTACCGVPLAAVAVGPAIAAGAGVGEHFFGAPAESLLDVAGDAPATSDDDATPPDDDAPPLAPLDPPPLLDGPPQRY